LRHRLAKKDRFGLILSTRGLSIYSDIFQDNGRRSDVNSQTRLFELELSPILEDTHVVDHHLGSVEFAENDSPDLTQKYDGEASDSSLGSLLDFQVSFHGMWIINQLTLPRIVSWQ